MHLFKKKIRAIVIYLHNTSHYPFKLGLIKFYLSDSIQKEFDISPFASIDLLTQQESKITDIFLTIKL